MGVGGGAGGAVVVVQGIMVQVGVFPGLGSPDIYFFSRSMSIEGKRECKGQQLESNRSNTKFDVGCSESNFYTGNN